MDRCGTAGDPADRKALGEPCEATGKEAQMNILVVNGSPRGKQGNTYILQEAFMRGAVSAGARVEEVFLKSKKISPCIGCMSCWIKTPGKCVQKKA